MIHDRIAEDAHMTTIERIVVERIVSPDLRPALKSAALTTSGRESSSISTLLAIQFGGGPSRIQSR
jgi:hypothetical protein